MRALAGMLGFVLVFAATRAAANPCVRPTDPGGFEGFEYGSSAVLTFGNAEILVWYTLEGPHAVAPNSSRADQVPDAVAAVAQVTAEAQIQFTQMGYLRPPSDALNPACGSNGGDDRLDVYLVHMLGAD